MNDILEALKQRQEDLDSQLVLRALLEAKADQRRINKFLHLATLVKPHSLLEGNLGAAAYELSVAIMCDKKMVFTDFNHPFHGELFRTLMMTLNQGDPILENICTADGDAIVPRDTA